MPGSIAFRSAGVALAATVGGVLFYCGMQLVTPRAEVPHATPPAAERSPSREDSVHEVKMLVQALKKKPQHAPVLFRMAQLAEEAGDHAKAAEHLREILRHEPGNQDARLELGKVLYQLGDVAGALDHTQAILKANPDHPEALYNLGAIYGNLGNGRLAREHWNHLIAVSPQSESAARARSMLSQLPSEPQTLAELHISRTTKDISGR